MNKKSESETLLMTTVKMILVVGVILFIFLPLIVLLRNFFIRVSREEESAKHFFETIHQIIMNTRFWEMLNYSYTIILPYSSIKGDYEILLEPSSSIDDSIVDEMYVDLVLYKDSKPIMKRSYTYFRMSEHMNYVALDCKAKKCYLNITFKNEVIPYLAISSNEMSDSVEIQTNPYSFHGVPISFPTTETKGIEGSSKIVIQEVKSMNTRPTFYSTVSSSFNINSIPSDKITSILISCYFKNNLVKNFPRVNTCRIGDISCGNKNIDFRNVNPPIEFMYSSSCNNKNRYDGVNSDYEYATNYGDFIDKISRNSKLLFPVKKGRITSLFGEPRYLRYHPGIDIAPQASSDQNIPIYAAHDGVVIFSGISDAGGIIVKIRSLDGRVETLYAHLDKVFVFTNQNVRKGEIIGIMGNTGRSEGKHLHYEVKLCNYGNCFYVDPVLNVEYMNRISDLRQRYSQERGKYSSLLFKQLQKNQNVLRVDIRFDASLELS